MSGTRAVVSPGEPEQHLSGAIERVTFHNPDSGFCVLRVSVDGRKDPVTVVGAAPSVAAGEYLDATGSWANDREHGPQFKATQLRVIAPTTLEGIQKYLGSGAVAGIGPHFAKKLVKAFGARVFDVIENEPQRLIDVPGIGPTRASRVAARWGEQRAVRAIMVFLHSHGIGTSRAVRIFKTYGFDAIARVTANPYLLALDIHGMGFKTADELARRLGVPNDSPQRAQAGVRHVLAGWSEQGHCYCFRARLAAMAAELLNVPVPVVERAIDDEVAAHRLAAEPDPEQGELLFLTALYQAEKGLARRLIELLAGAPPWGVSDVESAVRWVEGHTRMELSASQRAALATMLAVKVCVLTGGPGVGKTTLLNSLIAVVRSTKVSVSLCAPTGRAAKRLSEATGLEARTVHRLLEFDPVARGFKRNAEQPLDTDLVVLDECSMMDVVLMAQLLRAIPDRAAVLLVGDVDQLPSVGPGMVLADLIDSGALPVVRLTEIFRQARSSRIIVNAHRINRGEMPLAERDPSSDFHLVQAASPAAVLDKLMQVVVERIPARYGLDAVEDVQVLTPMNRGALGVHALNAELQRRLNGRADQAVERYGTRFALGDKVLQRVNNYDKDVYNGDIGRIRAIDVEDGQVRVAFDGREVIYEFTELDELTLAYAASIHKSQGSEYPAVVIPLAMQHYLLLERNLLYTAVTRGRQLSVVIAEPRALGMAVRNRTSNRRATRLAARLRELGSA